MLPERLSQELAILRARFGDVIVAEANRGIIIPRLTLPEGWSKIITRLLVLIPPGYPTTPPDNFYTEVDLRLAQGVEPANSSLSHRHFGQVWRQFSYHVDHGTWRPTAMVNRGHNLCTFLLGVERRLRELT